MTTPRTGQELRQLLADHGLAQTAAARLLRVSPRTVRNWIAGRPEIPFAAAEALRAYLAGEVPALAEET